MEMDSKQREDIKKKLENFANVAPQFLSAFSEISKILTSQLNNINPEEAKKYRNEIKSAPQQMKDALDKMNIEVKDLNDTISKL